METLQQQAPRGLARAPRRPSSRRPADGARPLRPPAVGARRVEWPTVALVAGCHGLWAAGLALWVVWPPAALACVAVAVAFHASLEHEVIHGHPTGRRGLDRALVWPAYGLVVPFGRYRDTHLAHHRDANLTDPHDDPESNYLDPERWARLPRWARGVLRLNNTLAGRLTLGPVIGLGAFIAEDVRALLLGDRRRARSWAAHLPAAGVVLGTVALSPMPLWAYALAAYGGHGLLKIRSYLEHVAHERASGRTAIVEDRGPLAVLFLNNNLHVVHHMHPSAPWYALPALYRARRARYLARNGGYVLPSYAAVFRAHLWRAKDPVPHPLMRGWTEGRAPVTGARCRPGS